MGVEPESGLFWTAVSGNTVCFVVRIARIIYGTFHMKLKITECNPALNGSAESMADTISSNRKLPLYVEMGTADTA